MLLAIDSATRLLSIALSDENNIRAEWSWYSENHHTVELAPHIQQLMMQSNVTPGDLTGLAVVTGPGSFTGLRIGMSYAKGLSLARNIPVIGVPTLDVIAAMQPIKGERLCAIVQAGRGRITPAFYRVEGNRWVSQTRPTITTWDALIEVIAEPTQFAGEINELGRSALSKLASQQDYVILSGNAFNLRRAGFLAQLALEKQATEASTPPTAALAPTYLT